MSRRTLRYAVAAITFALLAGGSSLARAQPSRADLTSLRPDSPNTYGGVFANGLRGPDGSATNVTYGFSGTDGADDGMYRIADNQLGFSADGTLRFSVTTTAVTSTLPYVGPDGSVTAPGHTFAGDTGVGMYLSSADTLGLVANGNVSKVILGGRLQATINSVLMLQLTESNFATWSGNTTMNWDGRTQLSSTTNGNLLLKDAAGTSFNLLQFGGTTSSFPALKKIGNAVHVVLADDSALTDIQAAKLLSPRAAGGIGYATGAGGVVTQLTSKSTGVTLNTATGEITMHNAALAASTAVSFTLTNTSIAATDMLTINHASGGTAGSYTLNAQCAAGSAVITVRNIDPVSSLGEAIVLRFAIIKGATN